MSMIYPAGYQFFDANGSPLDSGTINFYETGTTTDKAIYSDYDQSVLASNPYTLDSSGRLADNIYGNGLYTVLVKDSEDSTVFSRDDVETNTQTSEWKSLKLDYGAVGDGTIAGGGTDDSAAFLAAAAAGGPTYIPEGNYRVTYITACKLTQRGTYWFGAGQGRTTIIIDHTGSTGVWLNEYDQGISRLTITASTTRAALPYSAANNGIRKQPVDTGTDHAKRVFIEDVEIINQPGHGIYIGPSLGAGRISRCEISNNKGHGIVIDDGTIFSYSNPSRPGSWLIAENVIHDNGGHWCKCGDDGGASSQAPYRMQFRNNDCYRNATDAAVRKNANAGYIYGEDIVIELCGLGSDTSTSGAGTVGNLWVAGRNIVARNNRYINGSQPPVTVGNITTHGVTTRGVTIEGGKVSGMAANASPFVEIDPAARAVKVVMYNEESIDSMINTDAPIDVEWQKADLIRWDIETLATRLSSIQGRTIADDAVTTLEFSGDNAAFALVNSSQSGGGYALIWFRVGAAPSVDVLASSSVTVTGTTGALTGTTGTDTELTISAHTDNKLYIENRTGASRDYSVLILANLGGDLLRSEI